MKKFISILSACLIVVVIGFLAITLFKSSTVKSIEVVGQVQTIYFVGSTNDVNFNDAELKITYNDGSVKLQKLNKKLVRVNNFSTSVQHNGTMKLTYKSQTIDIGYSVICKGMYYLSEKVTETYNGNTISQSSSGKMIAGVNSSNIDVTTSTEMIYFGNDGVCDYYSRSSSTATWYADNGYYDKSFYYKITGNSINVHLGENNVYSLQAHVSNDGKLSLTTVKKEYVNGISDFLQKKITRNFDYYEMKGNRTITASDVSVYCSNPPIRFAKNSKFSDSNLKIYLKVTYSNDNFMKNVYVRFHENMFGENEFSTAVVTPSTTRARCYYNGIRFNFEYSVY